MSTSKSKSDALETALAYIPVTFRKRIIKSYLELKRRHAEAEYDAAGLSTGKFCEAVLRLLQNKLTGSHTPFGERILNFADACEKLTQTPKSAGNEALRIVIPRTLSFLYTLRNKRGIGHVGGDVDANEIDSATMARASDWITCELIRIYHQLSLEDAQALVDSISSRNIRIVWEIAGKKRVLQNGMNYSDQTLVLLYSDARNGVLTEDLFEWTEYSDFPTFKRSVLGSLHKKRFIEFDRESAIVYISPTGIQHVEEHLLNLKEKSG